MNLVELPSGAVIAIGGVYGGSQTKPIAVSEMYDPKLGVWVPDATLLHPRFGHTSAVLRDGGVLVIGGSDMSGAGLTYVEERQSR